MTKYVNNNGVSEMWLNIKNWVTSQLLGYSQTGHTHTKSQITDLDLSNYVDKTSNQTIHGNKAFTGYIDFNPYKLRIKHSSQEIGITPSSNQWNGIAFVDKNNSYTFTIEQAFLKSGNVMLHFSMMPNNASGSLLRIFETTYYASADTIETKSKTMVPDENNSRNLGSSSNVWKNVYGNNYYLGNTAFGNIVTHNASEFAQVGHTHSDYIPKSGGVVLTGGEFSRNVDDSYLNINAGTNWDKGAQLQLFGKDWIERGAFAIYATLDANTRSILFGKPNGTLLWNEKNVAMQEDTVPRSGGAVMSGSSIGKTTNNGEFRIDGGTDWGNGASLVVYGKDSAGHAQFRLYAHNGTVNHIFTGYTDGTLTWDGQPIQYVSDQRYKQQISEIDDDLLTAWEDVNLVQFKYNDAVKEKSDNARLHTGYVVQQIDEACKSHGVDVSKYGLYCHEVYQEETREVEQADGTKTKETKVIREASEHYSLRYTEVYAVECMYLRRCIARLTARIEELEKGNNVK